jgi:hypothetical protein
MTTTTRRRMPDEVRALRDPWPSLAREVKDLTWELEQDFRFGQRVTRTEQGYVLGGTMKGGSSSMWQPARREDYHAFRRWQQAEGILETRDDEAFERLAGKLARHGVELATRRHAGGMGRGRGHVDEAPFPGYGPLYEAMHGVLTALPDSHLERESLRRIVLGGWGPDAAKASAYQDGSVLMYDFACRGARRTFVGLFLHELGHAHEVALPEADKAALHEAYQVIAEADAFVGVEFLLDASTRKLYQRFVFTEFLAETYMVYASHGVSLRESFRAHAPPVQAAWERVYELFRRSFDGCEYE